MSTQQTTTPTETYYEIQHRPGYGRHDHLAGEVIARAARILGLDADLYLAQAAGHVSHSCPMGVPVVRLAAAPGVRAKMARAVRDARREFGRSPDCCVIVTRKSE